MGGKLGGGPFVELAGIVVVAVTVVFQGQAKQGPGMAAIVSLDGPFQQGDHFGWIAAQSRNRRRALIQILGRLFDGARETVEQCQRASWGLPQ